MAVYPHADQSRRYDSKYPGGYVRGAKFRGILHTTETTGLPSYSGGADAPHFTYDPRTGHIWQHFDTARPSRALLHIGNVQTNNQGAVQIEIVAYSDAAAAAKAAGIHVDRLTPGQQAPLIALMRWLEAVHKIRRASGLRFIPYPASAGINNGVRLGASSWYAFTGWAGHEHVPTNVHGDPADIDIAALLALPPAPPPLNPGDDDDMRSRLYFDAALPAPRPVYFGNGQTKVWVTDGQHLADIVQMMIQDGIPGWYQVPHAVSAHQVKALGVLIGDDFNPVAHADMADLSAHAGNNATGEPMNDEEAGHAAL